MIEPVTKSSLRARSLQKRFGAHASSQPAVFIDYDWFLLNSGLGRKPLPELVASYIYERAGIYIPANKLPDQAALSETIYKSSVHDSFFINRAPSNPLRAQFIIGAHPDHLNELFTFKGLLSPHTEYRLSQSALRVFIDYHETGHSVDTKYIPLIDYDPRADKQYTRHRAEMFADIFAAFLMAQEGYQSIGLSLAVGRLMDTIKKKYDAKEDEKEYDGAPSQDAYWYATYRGLRAAQSVIEGMTPCQLKEISIQDIIKKAYELTEAHCYQPIVGAKIHDLSVDNFHYAALKRHPALRHELLGDMDDLLGPAWNGIAARSEGNCLVDRFRVHATPTPETAKYSVPPLPDYGVMFAGIINDALDLPDASLHIARAYCEKKDHLRLALRLAGPATAKEISKAAAQLDSALKVCGNISSLRNQIN